MLASSALYQQMSNEPAQLHQQQSIILEAGENLKFVITGICPNQGILLVRIFSEVRFYEIYFPQ